MSTVIRTQNVPGNLHSVRDWVNERGLAEFYQHAEYGGGNYSVVVFKVPERLWDKLQNDKVVF